MLKEKMSYDKILRMLAEDETNPTLKETLKKIEGELKKGKEGSEVFGRYADIFGKFPAYMLGLATKSGNMAEVYEATAKFMEREMEFKKNLKQALVVPAFTVIALLGAVLYYVVKIFPATAELFLKFDIPLPPMTDFTLKMSDYLQSNWWWILLIIVGPIVFAFLWFFWEILRNAWEERNTPLGFFVLSTALVILVSGLVNSQILDAGTAFLLAVVTGLQNGFPKFAHSRHKNITPGNRKAGLATTSELSQNQEQLRREA